MKKIFLFIGIVFILCAYSSQGVCEASDNCTPQGTNCTYVCMEEVYCVGNMDKLTTIPGLDP